MKHAFILVQQPHQFAIQNCIKPVRLQHIHLENWGGWTVEWSCCMCQAFHLQNNYTHVYVALFMHSASTQYASGLPWGKCVLHYLYAEDLPQLVWIGLTTRNNSKCSSKDTLYIHAFCARAICALYARIPGATKCKFDISKEVLCSILHLCTTSGGQLNANGKQAELLPCFVFWEWSPHNYPLSVHAQRGLL